MRDMMATPQRLDDTQATRDVVVKAAAAAYEALPALLLAAALVMPALAAFATRAAVPADFDRQATQVRTGQAIAEQGDRALGEIRKDAQDTLRQNITLPKLS